MRQKCTTILKVSVALILALMMVVGSISTVVAATITIEQSESTTDSTAADNKAADVADDSADAPAQSVPLTDKLVRRVKDDIAGTGAAVDVAPTGYDHWYVKGDWEISGEEWVLHDISGNGYEVTLNGGTDYSFVFVANNDQFTATNCVITRTTDYNFSNKNKSESMTLRASITGKYKFIYKSMSGGDTSMSVRIEFPEDTTPDTWTVVGGSAGNTNGGQSDPLFTSTWDTTLNQNDMTNTSGTTWTWTKNNVTLNAGKILCKVVKNHTWDTAYPASGNQESAASLAAGTYNVTITFDSSTKDVTIAATQITKSTLTVQNDIDHATVKATYNGTTVGEGQSISNVPQGASVSISVTPDSGYQCTAVTGTYNTNLTVSGTGSGNSWTLAMPAANTTVSVTLGTVTMKKIYFNNNYTQYGTVYAYVYDKNGANHTYEYLGKRPGKVMTEPENSEIWYIEVPQDVDYVEFISGDGKTTGEMKIPWPNSGESTTYTYPKYTAPYNYDAPTIANGGTWGEYLWGSNNGVRANEYTVSDGSTMSAPNLFTGITATLYDYYTDGEITASAGTVSDDGEAGAPKGWIKGINSNEYTWTNSGWLWIPNTKLNGALIGYADDSNQPNYDITYPLYFGNLNYNSEASEVSGYYNYNQNVNNSSRLSDPHNAVTGLSGKTLGDDKTIHYYSADDTTNENGAPMAMFNEDFLSGENSEGKPLATILRTSSFPVRKETVGATTTYEYYDDRIYYTTSGSWNNDNAWTALYYWTASGTGWVASQSDSNGTYFTIPSGATGVQFVRMKPSTAAGYSNTNNGLNWDNKWNQIPSSGSAFTVDSTNIGKTFNITSSSAGSLSSDKVVKSSTTTGGHDYYEFDSTDGKDNAYIESIDKSGKTAVINYYNNTNKVHSNSDTDGFFPFNRNAYVPNQSALDYAQDLGFGMKLTIPFTLNGSGASNGINADGTDQTFDFSGDDDLWVFVDGKLVLDLGGAHARTTGSINFNTKTVTASNTQAIGSATRNGDFSSGFNTNENYVHTMTIYYMERGMFDSNLKFGFSFHAIPNQFWIDKKIRTKDRYGTGEYDTINSGFFTNNNQSDSASNMTTHTVGDTTTNMTKFEKSFQDEQFTVTQWYGNPSANTLATGKNYTIDYDQNTYTTGNDGQYPIKHDKGNAFIGQFTTGDKFKLIEDFGGNNKYVYKPKFSVWDQANNDNAIIATGDNDTGFTFDFAPTTQVTGGIENTNIKARFENFMVAHDLTLTKELTNTVDTTSTFTFQILFDFEGNNSYIAYPLYCDVDGTRTKLNNDGTITITAGQTVDIFEIPEKAKVQVTEVLTDTVSGYRYVDCVVKKGNTTVTPTTVTKGAQFVMGDGDMNVTFSNKKPDNKYTIKYTYKSYDNLYGNQSYTVSGVFTTSELDTYMQLDSSNQLEFKNNSLKKTFINNKAPYEDNFHEVLSFADGVVTDTVEGKGWINGNYYCDVTANATVDSVVNVYFNLPYAVDSDTTLNAKPESGTNIVKKATKLASGEKNIACFDWYVTDGKSHNSQESGGAPVFVKAPLMIYDYTDPENPTVEYFQYWSVKNQNNYGMKAAEYTRCYDYEFNLSLFMDCIIEPVYGASWGQSSGSNPNPNPPSSYNDYDRFDPELQIAASTDKKISVTFLENSRNQYNQGGKGRRDGADAMDVIYSDFLLSFNSDPGTQLNSIDHPENKKAGIVIEAVDYLEGDNTNGFNGSKDYSSDTKYTDSEATRKAEIVAWLTSGNNKPTGVAKSEFTVDALDNKNCIQYYYSIKNRNCNDGTAELIDTSQNRYKVYRAYAYIGDVDDSGLGNVEISEPVYFTIYDIGKMYDLADHATNVTP